MDHQKRLVGKYTMRNMYEHIQDVLFNQVLEMEPGSSRKVQPEGREKVAYAKITKYLRIMDSMTDEELDTTDQKLMDKSRIKRIARGSGCQVTEVVEMFRYKPFFSRYLGKGDSSGFMDRFKKTVKVDQHTTVKVNQHTELQEKQLEVIFTLRNMQQLYKNILDMGCLDQVLRMIMPEAIEERNWIKYKRYLAIMNSMTNEELDNLKHMEETRIMRIARGAGCQVREVAKMIQEYKRLKKLRKLRGKMMDVLKKGDMTMSMFLEKTLPYPKEDRVVNQNFYCVW